MKEVRVKAHLVKKAYENYLAYKKCHEYGDELSHYLHFKKLLQFDTNCYGAEEGGKKSKHYSSFSEYLYLSEQLAHQIRLLASDHFHALYRVMEAKTSEEDNIHADKWK
jgi:hypothetical protein